MSGIKLRLFTVSVTFDQTVHHYDGDQEWTGNSIKPDVEKTFHIAAPTENVAKAWITDYFDSAKKWKITTIVESDLDALIMDMKANRWGY